MGVENEFDAYLATKQAVYSILYDNDVDTYYRGGNERGTKILNAIKYMVNEGRYGNYSPENANVTVTKVGDLKDEENYYSQEYSVDARVNISNYTITGIINAPNGVYTTDMSNNSKTTFDGTEHFKVMMPKESFSSDINLKVNVQTKCKTYPVFFGATTIEGTQNYLISTDPYGDESGQGNLSIKLGKVKVIKVDKENNEVKLANVEFEIYDNENNLVDTLITDINGEAISKQLKINKEYTIRETKTLSDYVLNEEPITITLKENEIRDIVFENEKIKGYIQVNKTSSEYNKYSELDKGSPLSNASFEVYDSQNNLVDTITTDDEGKAITKPLTKGAYTIKEISSPKYYLLNKNIYNVEIVKDKEIVNVDITNDNVNIDVEIKKKGFIETQSKDNIFYNFSNIKNKSNVSLDNFTWSDHLPTNAVRINRIYTGTWNDELNYDVYYKTNLKDEYTLFKEKLNTQTIYELNFKELDLSEDEYITDFEFRFGTVKTGFQEIDSPILYCDIIEGLGNGFVFTNHTRVSGTYFEKYIEDNDDWTTVTYFKEIQINNVLPRTRNINKKGI